jgi:D-arabinose 1-dehydrogenase-like Zn-dependent alcohol dehydrogenase
MGTYATHILLGCGTTIVRLPDAVIDSIASPINCALATMVCAVEQLRDKRHASVLVQGAGMLGLYGVALLKRMLGVPVVVATDISTARLASATEFGADAVFCSSGVADAEQERQLLGVLQHAAQVC